VEELGRQVLAEEGTRPRIGFSADIVFTAKQREVQSILKVLSLDLVFNPARGGAFVRALNSVNGGSIVMSDKPQTAPAVTTNPPAGAGGEKELEAIRSLLQVQQEQARLAEEAEKAKALRVQMYAYLLDSGLAASKLPQAMQEHVRRQFAGRAFEPGELTGAIDDARKLVSDLVGGSAIQGPRVSGMFSSDDQLQAAVDDMFGAPRSKGMESLQAARLSGIRELYHLLTGDYDLRGGYHPDRVRLATTSDFSGLVANVMNKIVANQWEQLGRAGYDWWQRVSVQEHFNTLNTVTGTLVGTVGTLPSVSEGAEYTELPIGDSPETATFTKYGGYIPLTLELIDRDETRKLRAYPRELANAGIRKISALVAAIFTANSNVGPTMADTGALFNNTATTTAGGHKNLLTTALSVSEWEVVSTAVYNQPMLIKNATGYYGTGPKQALNPKYLLVPRNLELTAKNILYNPWDSTATYHMANMVQGEQGDVVVVPEWTDATDWAAACDPRIAPAIFVGERFGMLPEVYIAGDELSPAVFMNDEHRLKVRHFLAVWVNDFRPLHKSNVGG
jgi:hypothetical protein